MAGMTMLEKMAKAAYEKMTALVAVTDPGAPFLRWEELPEEQRCVIVASQRAALEAIHEPNEAIDDAVDKHYGHGAHEDWAQVWRIMVDAILEEKP